MRSHAPPTFAISPLRLSNDDEGRRQTAIVDQLPAVERRVLFDYGRPPRRLARSNLPERARASMLRMTRFLRIWGSGVRISLGAPLNNLKHMRFFSSASQFIRSDFSRGPKADPRELKIASDMPIPMAVSSGDHGLVRLRAGFWLADDGSSASRARAAEALLFPRRRAPRWAPPLLAAILTCGPGSRVAEHRRRPCLQARRYRRRAHA